MSADLKALERVLQTVVRTGKYLTGGREVGEGVRGAKLVILTRSLDAAMKRRVREACKNAGVPVMDFAGTSLDLGRLAGRGYRISAFAVKAAGEADLSEVLQAAPA